MRIPLNGFTARLLLVLLAPVVLPLKLLAHLRGERKPVYRNTIEGDPLQYNGDRPLVIAVWADWASVWKTAGPQLMETLAAEFGDRCEFAFVESTSKAIDRDYAVGVVPTFLIYRNGREVARFVNALKVEEIRPTLSGLVEGK